ncbi:PFL-like enzyme TdcE [Escherichia marmotae]|uniref:PFL-like enzyme TdcE n=1 Tax=Escherichia marmotae TaxID=1499973 RepID=A0A370V8T6_9ESCH|nr:PFL-like enzyme TdcE [Escherichia marmotae]RDR35744.1 PFL-like enzyme TdcE [Escherichia marmotae]RDR41938.1 PFL-like enzyme TdcE [Escherichia marmotae]RDR81821.1 PFL-like enzyme TdcE [Escherichia marmotae]RDS15577.1 PFL-like enzyme TdcE [Escherichia marmotae]
MKVDIDTSDKLYADAWLGFKGTDWKNESKRSVCNVL